MENIKERLVAALAARHGVDNAVVEFELKPALNVQNGEFFQTLPPLYFTWSRPKGRKARSYVEFVFCPFCGEKLKGPPAGETPL